MGTHKKLSHQSVASWGQLLMPHQQELTKNRWFWESPKVIKNDWGLMRKGMPCPRQLALLPKVKPIWVPRAQSHPVEILKQWPSGGTVPIWAVTAEVWAEWYLADGQKLAICIECWFHEDRHFCLFCILLFLCLEECLAHSGHVKDAMDREEKQWLRT